MLVLSLLSVILRFFSFFPSVIDHDESTYLEIARQLLAGKVLYVDMIDIKPPGIFLILACFQFLLGYSIFVMRLMASLWIALTAYMVYQTAKQLLRDNRSAAAAGIIYVFFLSTWSFYGVSITPEIFFNLSTITALYILLRLNTPWKYLLAGITAGLGFMIKYFVLLDFGIFLLFFIFIRNGGPYGFKKVLKGLALLILALIGFFLPFGLCNLYYYSTGHFDAFVNIIYHSPLRYPSPINPLKMTGFLLDLQLRFFPLFFFFYYALLDKKLRAEGLRSAKWLLGLWALAALVAVVISGNHYGHYTIQLMLPVSLTAGLFFHSGRIFPTYLKWNKARITGFVALSCLILLISGLKLEYVIRHDMPREIANYLKPRLKEGDLIYSGNYHHILYYLLRKDSPTPYIHRSLLLDDRHIKALAIDQQAEFENIMRQRPLYIVTQKEYPDGVMKEYISTYYEVEIVFEQKIRLYRRK